MPVLVNAGVYSSAMERLLEEGDYARGQKKHHKVLGTVTTIYWLAVTVVFLIYTYGPSGNGQPRYSWIIWAVAGVLYAAVMGVVRLLLRRAGKTEIHRAGRGERNEENYAEHPTSDQDLRRQKAVDDLTLHIAPGKSTASSATTARERPPR